MADTTNEQARSEAAIGTCTPRGGCDVDPCPVCGCSINSGWTCELHREPEAVIAGGSECADCGAAPDPDFEPQADHVVRCPDCAAARWHDLKIIRGTYSNGRPSYHAECPCGWQMVGTADSEESARSIGSHHAFLELGAGYATGPIIAGGSDDVHPMYATVEAAAAAQRAWAASGPALSAIGECGADMLPCGVCVECVEDRHLFSCVDCADTWVYGSLLPAKAARFDHIDTHDGHRVSRLISGDRATVIAEERATFDAYWRVVRDGDRPREAHDAWHAWHDAANVKSDRDGVPLLPEVGMIATYNRGCARMGCDYRWNRHGVMARCERAAVIGGRLAVAGGAAAVRCWCGNCPAA